MRYTVDPNLYYSPPDNIAPGIVYVLREKAYDIEREWVAFKCPCTCGLTVKLNTNHPEKHPCWEFKNDNGVPTLTPSVVLTEHCQSHFILTNGNIHGVSGDERTL